MNAHKVSQTKRIGLILITLCVMCAILLGCSTSNPPPPPQQQPESPSLPDLVLLDIILKPKPAGYGNQDDIIVNTVVRNNGTNATQGFLVWCSFQCKDPASYSPTYFSGMEMPNGLGGGQQVTLGDDTLLSLSDCPFQGSRTFTCVVDQEDHIKESNEANNTLEEVLLTNR